MALRKAGAELSADRRRSEHDRHHEEHEEHADDEGESP